MIGVSGFFCDPTGYGEMARRLLLLAAPLGPLKIVGTCTDGGGQQAADLPDSAEGTVTDHVIVAAPHQFEMLRTEEGRQIGYTCWETDRLPDKVVWACAMMDVLLVPSQQMVDTFAKHGLQAKLVPIPGRRIEQGSLPVVGIKEFDTVFYSCLTWQPRKNPMGLLTAYLTEFDASDPVVLVVKVGGGHADLRVAQAEYAKLLKALALPAPPRVILVGGQWSPAQMQALHEQGDCYVTLTRGEAFGIPIADAVMAGSRVIATDWGGHLDFLAPGGDPRRGVTLVGSRPTPVVQEYTYFDGTQCWAEPDIMDARVALRGHMFPGGSGVEPPEELSVSRCTKLLREALWPPTL